MAADVSSITTPQANFAKFTLNKNGEIAQAPYTNPFTDLMPGGFLRFDINSGQIYTETMQQTVNQANQDLTNLNPLAALESTFNANKVDFAVGLVGFILVAASLVQIVKPV